MAQSVERHLGKVEVTGSIPVGSLEENLEQSRLLGTYGEMKRHSRECFFDALGFIWGLFKKK